MSSSNFLHLPLTVQLNILRRLDHESLGNGRFVCKHWLACINFIHRPTVKLSDDSLDLQFFNESSYEYVGTLEIASCKKPLPINSTKRRKLPQSDKVILGRGISAENVLKLLRYYSMSCKTLCLSSLCFENVPPCQMKGRIESSKLSELEIKFQPNWFKNTININQLRPKDYHLHGHMNSISKFLSEIRLPCLQILHIDTPVSAKLVKKYYLRHQPPPPILFSFQSCIDRFDNSLDLFVKRHGVQLKSFHIDTPSTEAFNLFENLPNVKDLTIILYNYSPRFKAEEALNNFKRLEILNFRIHTIRRGDNKGAEDRITSLMVENNKHTLKYFTFRRGHWYTRDSTKLNWLYTNPGLVLTRIEMNTTIDFGYNLEQAYLFDYQLNHVKEFRFIARRYGSFLSSNQEMRDLYKWIIQVMPNLKNLEMKAFVSPTLAMIKSMILKLRTLGSICLFGRVVPDEIENWCCHYPNEDIRGAKINSKSYKITIRRPVQGPFLIK